MSDGSFTNAASAQAELNVSIAGSTHETMAAALDEAVARLDQVTHGTNPQQHAAPQHTAQTAATHTIDPASIVALLQSLCAAETRQLALAEMIGFLDARSADCTVRAGLGKDRLNRIYDPRLGWLGTESSLFDQLRERWELPRNEDGETHQFHVAKTEEGVVALMNQPSGAGRCMVWIDGTSDQLARVSWLPGVVSAFGTALWSRPGRAWPSKVANVCQRSSASVASVAILLVAISFWPVHYRVACKAKIETTAQRLIATPFDATLERSNFKPGDIVSAGDVLMVLDGRPLRLEREAIMAERQQVAKEHDSALATGRIADSQQATLKKRQLARRYDLLSDRLAHLEVVSPIDGVVVSGDLERYVGSPLERGQTVMEIAPMDRMVIEVEIPEHEIGYVTQGAETRIKLDAIGGKSIRQPIENIFPRAELRDDQNVFIAKIEVDNEDRSLKPGMIGEATTYGPLRPWLWSWVRGGVEKVLWWIGY